MRDKLRQHHGVATADPKHSSGGIVDLEFISQYLVLGYAAEHAQLYRYSDNIRILDAAAACGLMSLTQAQQLQQAYQQLRGSSHRQTLAPAEVAVEDLSGAEQQVRDAWQQFMLSV